MYEPLSSAKSEIRLFRLWPRYHALTTDAATLVGVALSATICGLLETARLDDVPKYMALSYMWGDENDTLPISLAGTEVQTTRNLVHALLHIQGDTEVVTLWVDAICINQKDAAEKTAQVLQMRRIY